LSHIRGKLRIRRRGWRSRGCPPWSANRPRTRRDPQAWGESYLSRVPHGSILRDGVVTAPADQPLGIRLRDQQPLRDPLNGLLGDEAEKRLAAFVAKLRENGDCGEPPDAVLDVPLRAFVDVARRDRDLAPMVALPVHASAANGLAEPALRIVNV